MKTWRRVLFGRRPVLTLVRLATLLALSVGIFGFWLIPIRAYGASMLPTLTPGRLTLVNALAYRWREPARGDVVAIRLAGRRVVYVKRIIGLPGERLRIGGGTVYVDGAPIEEPYVKYRADWDVPEIALGADQYFVVGDNRGMNPRQHDFGVAQRNRLVGRVLF